MKGHFIVWFFFLFYIKSVHAVNSPKSLFTNIDSKHGLSDNNVRSIFQLPDGRIAAFTEGLLNIYNASFFHYVHTQDRNVYSLAAYDGYHRTYMGTHGLLWIKDYRRLYLFDIHKDIYVEDVRSWLLERGVNEVLANFFMDSNHNYWLLTISGRLFTIPANEAKAIYVLDVFKELGLHNKQLLDLSTHGNQLYIYSSNGEVQRFDLTHKKRIPTAQPFNAIEKRQFAKIGIWVPQDQGMLLLANGNKGVLLRYDESLNKWYKLLQEDYWLSTIAISKQQDIYLSCQYGVWNFDAKTNKWKLWNAFSLIGDKILKTSVNSVFLDYQDGLWLGTTQNGLLYYHSLATKFRFIPNSAIANPVNATFKINAIAQFKGSLFLGTTEGLYVKDSLSNEFRTSRHIAKTENIYQLSYVWGNTLLINASNDGLYIWKENENRHVDFGRRCLFYTYPLTENNLLLNFGTGLELYNIQTQNTEVLPRRLGVVYQMSAFPKSNKLIGIADEGVFLYDKATNNIEVTGTFQRKRPPFLQQNSNRYTCLFTDSRELLWMGTWDGLSVWNTKDQSLHLFHTENGLVNNRIQSIIEDIYGNIWVATAAGITQIQLQEKSNGNFTYTFLNYYTQAGVMANSFTERSVFSEVGRQIIWSGHDGLNFMDIQNPKAQIQLIQNEPILTKLFIQGKQIVPGDTLQGKGLLTETIGATKNIKLAYNQNALGFEFTTLQFDHSAAHTYLVQLVGADGNPIPLQTENGLGRINYNNLTPGTYELYIYASDGKKPQQPILSIEITPAPWATPLAYAFYVFISIGVFMVGVLLFLRYRNKQIEKKHTRANALKNKKISILSTFSVAYC